MRTGGGSITPNADGYAIPGPADLFAVADVYAPHADYPAWDWLIPIGTPIYAIRGGTVTTVQYWPHNWWDQGCGTNPTGCRTCGIGVTIVDIDGNHWAYCHGTPSTSKTAKTSPPEPKSSPAATPAAPAHPTSTSRSPPPDGVQSCLQPLLRGLRLDIRFSEPAALPAFGCFY